MRPRAPKLWSLTTLTGSALAVTGAVAAMIVVTAGGATAGADTQSQIVASTEGYLQAMATGDKPLLTASVCAATMADFPGFVPDPTPKTLLGVTQIVVDADTATGSMMIDDPSSPDTEPGLVPVRYVNEDGWKLCN